MLNRHAEHHAAHAAVDALPDVGLYVDDERSIAAVSRPSRSNPSLHVASLHRTVLYVHGDGSASLGGTDDPNAVEFTEFVAQDVPSGFEPGALVAMTLRCLLAEVAGSVGADMSLLAAAATYPSTWTAEQVSAVRVAMNEYELHHVALVAETEALAAWAESTQATWAGSDTGIAAARGAAAIASSYPVDAVTEEITLARPARPMWTRTPVLAAVAFAAVLAFGGAVSALILQDSSGPSVPEIDGAPVARATTTASPTPALLPFPTVVPIIEPLAPPVIESPAATTPDAEPQPTTESTTAEDSPRTRPAAAETPAPEQTEDPTEIVDPKPVVEPAVPEDEETEPEEADPSDTSDTIDPDESAEPN